MARRFVASGATSSLAVPCCGPRQRAAATMPPRRAPGTCQEPRAGSLAVGRSAAQSAPGARGLRPRGSSVAPRAMQATAAVQAGPLTVEFAIPYCTSFGQEVRMVGSAEQLGQWDVTRALSMTWTDGHIWRGEAPLAPGEVEYKYVVVSSGDSPAWVLWQPGDNMIIEIPQEEVAPQEIERIVVQDQWDRSSRGVELRVREVAVAAAAATHSLRPDDILSAAALPATDDGVMRELAERLDSAGLAPEAQLELLSSSVDRVFKDLDAAIEESTALLDSGLVAATSSAAIEADRRVARIAETAIRMVRALESKEQEVAGLLSETMHDAAAGGQAA